MSETGAVHRRRETPCEGRWAFAAKHATWGRALQTGEEESIVPVRSEDADCDARLVWLVLLRLPTRAHRQRGVDDLLRRPKRPSLIW